MSQKPEKQKFSQEAEEGENGGSGETRKNDPGDLSIERKGGKSHHGGVKKIWHKHASGSLCLEESRTKANGRKDSSSTGEKGKHYHNHRHFNSPHAPPEKAQSTSLHCHAEICDKSDISPPPIPNHSIHSHSPRNAATLPGAVREGNNGYGNDQHEYTTIYEESPLPRDDSLERQGRSHEESLFPVVSAHRVEDPILVSAVEAKDDQDPKFWAISRNRIIVIVVVAIIASLAIGLGLALTLRDTTSGDNIDEPEPLAGNWVQVGQDIVGASPTDGFGSSISLSADGNTIAIGALYNDANGASSGHVRLYRNNVNNGEWEQLGHDIIGEASGDQSGWSVALSADSSVVAVGAWLNDGAQHGDESNSGHVRVFENADGHGNWTQIGQDLDGEAPADEFGTSVALSLDGGTVAIGGDENNGETGKKSGHVRVFVRQENGKWIQLGDDIDGEASNDSSGWYTALSYDGTVVAIGAPWNSENGEEAGHVRVFVWTGGEWAQVGKDIDGTQGAKSGYSVSMSSFGEMVAVGAVGYQSDRGLVRALNLVGNEWEQIGQNIVGKEENDGFGWSTSLSSYGTVLAVGAPQITGSSPGYARVFLRNVDDVWVQLGQDIVGLSAGEFCGWKVSLSTDGTTLAVASPFTGHVRVYHLTEDGT